MICIIHVLYMIYNLCILHVHVVPIISRQDFQITLLSFTSACRSCCCGWPWCRYWWQECNGQIYRKPLSLSWRIHGFRYTKGLSWEKLLKNGLSTENVAFFYENLGSSILNPTPEESRTCRRSSGVVLGCDICGVSAATGDPVVEYHAICDAGSTGTRLYVSLGWCWWRTSEKINWTWQASNDFMSLKYILSWTEMDFGMSWTHLHVVKYRLETAAPSSGSKPPLFIVYV